MIVRNAAARHGRRALASPISRSTLRQLSSESVRTEPAVATPPPKAQLPADPIKDHSLAMSSKQLKMWKAKETIMTLGANTTATHEGQSWTRSRKMGGSEELTSWDQWVEFRKVRAKTKKLGSIVKRQYNPTDLINDPPRPQDVTLELLMASQTHMGHHTSLWNPGNSRYIYGIREGIHIISLETTAAHLRRAARVVEEVARCGGLILFVGTRKGQMEIVTKASELAGACHVFTKWTPGGITNRDAILKYATTKVVDEKDQPLDDFGLFTDNARPLLPDLVVCLNPKENYTLLYECGLKDIPTIGVIDTDADPTWVTYTIPANDDSLRSIGVIAGVLGRAGERGQELRKLASEKKETIPWETSPTLNDFMSKHRRNVLKEQRLAVSRAKDNVVGFNEEEQHLLQSQYARADLDSSEAAMLEVLGETATVEGLSEPTTSTPSLGDIETQLTSVKTKAEEVQAELEGLSEPTTSSPDLGDIEAQLASARTKAGEVEAEIKGLSN